jgi:hypothetical protein
MVCKRHHRAVHEGGWRMIRPDEHTTTWINPIGNHTHVHPPDFPIKPRAG